MNATQDIKISDVRQEIDGWRRYIYLEREGKSYELILFWDQFNGYEITWRYENEVIISKAPEWATNWNENAHGNITLEHYLDELTYEKLEEVK